LSPVALAFTKENTDKIIIKINNNSIYFDVNPIIRNGRVLVPLRKIFESLGAKVTWNSSTNSTEKLNNSNFKPIELERFKNEAG
jgi:hypothetical protein